MADEPVRRVQEMYDAYGALTEVWGGDNIHLGIFLDPDEPLAVATERANARLAAGADLQPGAIVLETAASAARPGTWRAASVFTSSPRTSRRGSSSSLVNALSAKV